MSVAGDLVAFQAAVVWLKERDMESILQKAYEHAKQALSEATPVNCMKEIYDAVPEEELIREISKILTPPGLKAELEVVYLDIDALHKCCPQHKGDWYFTGNYPTPGGVHTVNQALVNYMEHKTGRSY